MLDPFPLPAPTWLSTVAAPAAEALSLPTIPAHLHEILLSALFHHLVCAYLSPFLSRMLFPRSYPSLPAHSRLNWDVHVVSLVQSVAIVIFAFYVMFCDEERATASTDWRERVWGYTGALGLLQSLATGYFAWDLVLSAKWVGIFGWGLLAHAVCALCVYLFGFRPMVNFYGPNFILYELSSPFLNVHWFCDKLHLTGSNLQLYNGIILIVTFFSSRLIWGVYSSYCVYCDISKALSYQQTPEGQLWLATRGWGGEMMEASGKTAGIMEAAGVPAQHVPIWLAAMYLGSNTVLTLLNVHWFGKMIQTVRARFEPPLGTKKVAKIDGEIQTSHKKTKVDGQRVRIRRSSSDARVVELQADVQETRRRTGRQ